MNEFRLPRKRKKSFKGKLLLYPPDSQGNSLMAWPTKIQKDYDAWQKGTLRDIFDIKRVKEDGKKLSTKLNQEIIIPDDQLLEYVNDIFREDLRSRAFRTFVKAKNSKVAVEAYYNFVNAHKLHKKDRSFGNICCLALDRAEELLRKENSIGKKRK